MSSLPLTTGTCWSVTDLLLEYFIANGG